MAEDQLELNCLVFGDDPSYTFPVTIAATESIDDLRTAIKEEVKPAFDHVTADSLDIFKVSIPIDDDVDNYIHESIKHPENISRLPASERLSDIFSLLENGHVHVLVQVPPTDFRLNCLICDDNWMYIFSVKVAVNKSVRDLGIAIKEAKKPALDHVDLHLLEIFRVSIPIHHVNDHINELIRDLRDNPKKIPRLLGSKKLSDIFSLLEYDHVHIAVKVPLTDLQLNCFVLGDDPNYIFPVKIAATKTVGDLGIAIKEEKKRAFDHITANLLEIFKVSIPFNDCINSLDTRLLESNSSETLSVPAKRLKEIFPLLEYEHVHIIVKVPFTHLQLNCLVFGDDPSHIFPVKIAATESVGALKDAIKEKQKHAFDHITANSLKIFKVSVPADSSFDEKIQSSVSNDVEALSPMKRLSDVFDVAPVKEHVHIVVKLPSSDSLSQPLERFPPNIAVLRQQWLKAFPPKAPSEGGKLKTFLEDQGKSPPGFRCHRPSGTDATIPLALYNSIFGQFQDDCETYIPTKEDYKFALRYSDSMSEFYLREDRRAQQSRDDFSEYYGLDFLATRVSGYLTGGDLQVGEFHYAIQEVKQELCLGSADPLFEGAWYYVSCMRPLANDYVHSNLPCFLLYVCGAHIGFAGAIWTGEPHFQVLAPMLPLFYHSNDLGMRDRTARYLGAAKKAILALRAYYEFELPQLNLLPPTERPRPDFPYPTEYTPLNEEAGEPRRFRYDHHPLSKDNLIFYAEDGDTKLCVKFVRRYSKEAHLRCASLGFAPALRGYEVIPGGYHMVVMDFLGDEYLELWDFEYPHDRFEAEVRRNITKLHGEGFVHGDIRTTNVMVKKNGSSGIMLIDFDWAGKIGEVRYPANVNYGFMIRRPLGVHYNELIEVEHDIAMVDFMFE